MINGNALFLVANCYIEEQAQYALYSLLKSEHTGLKPAVARGRCGSSRSIPWSQGAAPYGCTETRMSDVACFAKER